MKILNFNQLNDIKEGWLPDTLPDKNVEEKKEEKIKPADSSLKRKRGRPKKIEIFKNDFKIENEIQITAEERESIIRNDICNLKLIKLVKVTFIMIFVENVMNLEDLYAVRPAHLLITMNVLATIDFQEVNLNAISVKL
jgi:hypothetical protein